jgi:hypothetical protein
MKLFKLTTITTAARTFERAVVKLSRILLDAEDLRAFAGLTSRHFNRAEKPLKIIRQFVLENLEQCV